MAAGTPVVSSPVPAAVVAPRRQALKHTGRQSTRLVDPLDVSSIAQGLIDVVLKQDLRDELIEAGSERVRGLTWKAAAEHHLHLWKGMIE
jgi:glycosyltransferase involved in cell wall biosynthesis